jgi:hypothetical protein
MLLAVQFREVCDFGNLRCGEHIAYHDAGYFITGSSMLSTLTQVETAVSLTEE